MAAGALLLALAAALPPTLAESGATKGVSVHAVTPGGVAEQAGLRPGDLLWRFEQGEASGAIASPFDLAEAALEYGPRGPVRLVGERFGEPLTVSLSPDEWGLETRPSGADEPWRLLQFAKAAVARKELDAAAAAVEEGVRAASAAGRPVVEAHLLTFLGEALREAEQLPAAAAAYDRALDARRRAASGPLAAAALADPISRTSIGPLERRMKLLRDAVAAYERLAPESRGHVRMVDALFWTVGGPEGIELAARNLALAERVAPASTLLAQILFSAAWTNQNAEKLSRALRIQERLEPESRQTAVTLSFLGRYLDYEGQVERALEYEQRALRLLERIAPGTEDHAHAVNNLALYRSERGDLVEAEALYRRTLEIEERRSAEGFGVARGHYNLGRVLFDRRDFDQAKPHLERAWSLTQAHGYGRGLSGRILDMLGRILREQGDLAAAETVLRRSLEIVTKVDPGQIGNARQDLADVLTDAGRFTEAETLYRLNVEAAAASPLRFVVAERHHALGSFAMRRGDLETAEREHRQALALRREQVPDSMFHAESSHALGTVARRRAHKEDALALFQEAVRALEAQGLRLGGTEDKRAAFRAHYQQYYRDLEELLLELGRGVAAFETMERSRARGLPALLASRDIGLQGVVPPELDLARRSADAEYDRVFAALNATGFDDVARAALEREHDAARHGVDDVRSRIRAVAPRVAALRDPDPLDLAGVRQALEPGTLVLAYSLGDAASRVYAVGPGPAEFGVLLVAATRQEVEDSVRRFRETIEALRSGVLRGPLATRSAALGRLLLAPAAGRIRRARRIVIVPDGALHVLPFAALGDPSAPGRYLVEAKPVSTVSSMTLYRELSRPGPEHAGAGVIGFGDPAYGAPADDGAAAPATASLRRARQKGLRLDPLPATRRELLALKGLSASAQVWLGSEATEEQAKAIGPAARVVHFACHGFLDERLPLESGLALSVPAAGASGGENGFLQAWEVFEKVRVEADLVTLSACQSGLGKEMGGEGLLGLTWAFQYAGARNVLASLWEVSDASTAELMKAFYAHLAARVPKAEALRRAQVALLRRPRTSAPYHWAAFTLIGAAR